MQGAVLTADLSSASVVTVYLLPGLIGRLQGRFIDELAPGTRIVCTRLRHGGPIPDRSETVRLTTRHPARRREHTASLDCAGAGARRLARRGFRCASSRTTSGSRSTAPAKISGRDIAWPDFKGRVEGNRIVGELAGRPLELCARAFCRIHQPFGIERAFQLAHEFKLKRALALANRLALELTEAMLGGDRTVERADGIVDDSVHDFAILEQALRPDVVCGVAVPNMPETEDLEVRKFRCELRAGRCDELGYPRSGIEMRA